jgi:hypothetical protein
LKFCKKQSEASNTNTLEQECKLWHDLWGFSNRQFRVERWGMDDAIVMPFVMTVRNKSQAALYKAKAHECIETLARTHRKNHTDLKWHHVGVYRRQHSGDVQIGVLFIDLSSVEDLSDDQTLEQAVAEMHSQLDLSYAELPD